MYSSRFAWYGAVVVSLLVSIACVPAASPQPAVEPATSLAGSLKKVRIAAIPGGATFAWPYNLAKHKGWFAEEGLEVELTYTFEQVPALIGGSIDIMSTGADEQVVANVRGSDIVSVGVLSNRPIQFFVTLEDITDVKQLEGKSIGMTDIGSSDFAITRRLLKEKGVDINKVTFRKIGGSRNRLAALQARQIHAAPLDPIATVTAQRAGMNILETPTTLGYWPWNHISVKRDWGEANRDLVVRALKVIYRAMAYINDPRNDEDLIKIIPSAFEIEPSLFQDILQLIRSHDLKLFDAERPKATDLEPVVELAIENGVIREKPDLTKMVDTSYYDAAFGQR